MQRCDWYQPKFSSEMAKEGESFANGFAREGGIEWAIGGVGGLAFVHPASAIKHATKIDPFHNARHSRIAMERAFFAIMGPFDPRCLDCLVTKFICRSSSHVALRQARDGAAQPRGIANARCS